VGGWATSLAVSLWFTGETLEYEATPRLIVTKISETDLKHIGLNEAMLRGVVGKS